MKRGLSVRIAKQYMVLDGSMKSRITTTVLGLAAEIERDLISQRNAEAPARHRAAGKPIGRSKGQTATRLKFDLKDAEIRCYLAKGNQQAPHRQAGRVLGLALYDLLARRNIRTPRHAA